uniref:Major facilitator superfamily (MFS) profile domain-containing protein n=1 Tax=Octactis speculum TaxID=3111310 RepID=A0A7S2ALL9_9STRA
MIGGVSTLVLFLGTDVLYAKDSQVFLDRQNDSEDTSIEVKRRLVTWKYISKLIGSGGSWFIYDFTSFGIRNYESTILDTVFDDDSLVSTMDHELMMNSLTAPGLVLSIVLLSYISPKSQVLIAAAICAIITAIFAYTLEYHSSYHTVNFVLLCSLYFMQGFGGGICNYCLCTDMYPLEVRSTFSGISGGIAKFGGVLGIVYMYSVGSVCGDGITLGIMALLYVVMFIITWVFCDSDSEMRFDQKSDEPIDDVMPSNDDDDIIMSPTGESKRLLR